jgi:DNA-binding Xre family transcriptional regulator
VRIKIINKIEEKITEYQIKNGATRTWIASKMGMTPQRMYQIMKAENMMLDVIVRVAIALECTVDDLIEYKVIK